VFICRNRLQWCNQAVQAQSPPENLIRCWALAALSYEGESNAGVTIRVVDVDEIQRCNGEWRGKEKATNVLSFAAELPAEVGIDYLGDILICAEVLQQESLAQGKSLEQHWAHIVVHGVLHLKGYDHETDRDAEKMEQREIEILGTFGIDNPYED